MFDYSRALPDFKWINREIPILEVAQKVGLVARGRRRPAHCAQRDGSRSPLSFNGWKCWECEPTGNMHSVIDLVMLHHNCSPYEAAKWVGENWKWPDGSRLSTARTRAVGKATLTSAIDPSVFPISLNHPFRPGSLSRLAGNAIEHRGDRNNSLCHGGDRRQSCHSIGRRALGELAGVHKPVAIARAVREMEAIGLFAVDRGSWGNGGYKPSTFKLTWWSRALQAWLGERVLPLLTLSPHHPDLLLVKRRPSVLHPPTGPEEQTGMEVIHRLAP